MEGKYSIELFRDGGEGAGVEKILVRHDSLTVARALYKVAALNCSERLIMLCDRARVMTRGDRPETMPEIKKAAPFSIGRQVRQRPQSWISVHTKRAAPLLGAASLV